MGTDLDALVIENFYLEKNMQDIGSYEDYKNKYELIKYEKIIFLINPFVCNLCSVFCYCYNL